MQQAPVRCRCLLRRQQGHPHGYPLHRGGGLAGTLCHQHVYQPTAEELANFEPDFVVYNASKAKVENYKELGLNSETCVAFNITSKEQVIINTWYGGEMKKGMFSMMNYFLPLKGMASMHCSANTDKEGKNTAIFFGLSGTGKTTLSTDRSAC